MAERIEDSIPKRPVGILELLDGAQKKLLMDIDNAGQVRNEQ